VNVDPAAQRHLLEIADLDARIAQAERARTTPPQAARVKQLIAERSELSRELSRLLGERDDARAELSRIEADVAVVDTRAARDAQRLAATADPKAAQGFESEIAALARRKSALEDQELAVMERLEQLDAAVAVQEALVAQVQDEGARLSSDAKALVADATARREAAERDRAAVSADVPTDLLTMYDRIAQRTTGAALLQHGTCGGCRMVLAGTDLQTIRAAAPDAVVTCPECGAILVRTEESGL
jgi:predicted  nucleic acid-binding Zn-ribbon protein